MPAVVMRVESLPAASSAWLWYVVGAGTWFLSFGLNGVIVPALVTQQLRGGGGALALAQSSSQLPTVALILIGGAVADRADRRRLLIALHGVASALTAALAFGVHAGALSMPLVVAYGIGMGTVSAFLMPARDALLSDVSGGNLMRAVSVLTMTQWSMQALGSFSARIGASVGIVALIAIQATILLAGAPAIARLPRRARSDRPKRATLSVREFLEGVGEVARSPVLGPVALLAIALGVFFIGPFLVVFPLLVRDYYGGDLADLSLLFGCFPLGIIASSAWILARGGLRRKGMAQLGSLAIGALCMIALGLGLPFWLALVVVFLFGLGGAMFMNASRTLFQEKAPPAHRGRVLSVYSLSTMGASGLLGAPVSGLLVAHFGPLVACGLAGVAMLAVIAGFLAFTRIRELE
jgi:MFS family permease